MAIQLFLNISNFLFLVDIKLDNTLHYHDGKVLKTKEVVNFKETFAR